MKIQAIIITCPERAQVLHETVSRLEQTGLKGPAFIQIDCSRADDRRARQTGNWEDGLKWFLGQSDADFALILEDDLDFNPHLYWNVERWSPVVEDKLQFGSLYNPNVRSIYHADDYFVADPGSCYGSQAYLLSREAASIVLHDWREVIGMQDIKVTRILGAAGHTLYYHRPSLVQHVGVTSVWGGGFHQAQDFDRTWRATFSFERIPGWFTFPKLYQQAVAEARDGDVLVEIGSWLGRSTAFLGETIKASQKRLKILVIDTFRGYANEPHMLLTAQAHGGSVRKIFERNMRLAGVWPLLEIHEASSGEAAAAIPGRSCSFAFIDADHRYEAVRNDIRTWIAKIRPGGILAGHDCYTYADVYNAVRDELGTSFETTDENVWIHRAASA